MSAEIKWALSGFTGVGGSLYPSNYYSFCLWSHLINVPGQRSHAEYFLYLKSTSKVINAGKLVCLYYTLKVGLFESLLLSGFLPYTDESQQQT